jgi:hypothetical protein
MGIYLWLLQIFVWNYIFAEIVDLRYRVSDAGQVFQVALGVVGTAVLAVGAADSVGHGAAPEPGAGQLAAGLAVCARVLSKYFMFIT